MASEKTPVPPNTATRSVSAWLTVPDPGTIMSLLFKSCVVSTRRTRSQKQVLIIWPLICLPTYRTDDGAICHNYGAFRMLPSGFQGYAINSIPVDYSRQDPENGT